MTHTATQDLATLAHRFVNVDGYWIQPHMIDHARTTPDRVVCTNGVTIKRGNK